MNAQPLQGEILGPEPVRALSPIAKLKPLMNEHGELELSNLQIGERMERFLEFAKEANCNLPLWESNLFSIFPAGTTLVPIPVTPGASDCWDGEDARKIGLKDNQVEPAADFILKLGNMLDIQLKQTFCGVDNSLGCDMLSIRYNAYLTLPNGAVISVEDEGKDQCVFTTNGTMQAHIVEGTRKKAKRNAIRALLGIPLKMSREDFMRPWVLLRPVFRPGVSDETDAIIAAQKQINNESMALLYGKQSVDLAEKGPTFEGLKAGLLEATNMSELEEMGKRLRMASLTGDERGTLGSIWKAKKEELTATETTSSAEEAKAETAPVTTASAETAPEPAQSAQPAETQY